MAIPQPRVSKQYEDRYEDKSFDDLVEMARIELEKKKSSAPWILGDIALAVSARATREGDRDLISEFLARTGMTLKSFQNNRWLAMIFSDLEVRSLGLSWTHYRLAAGTDDPVAIIRRAATEAWSTRQLDQFIRQGQPTDAGDGAVCAVCRKPLSGTAMFTLRGPFGTAEFDSISCVENFVSQLKEAGERRDPDDAPP